MTAPETIWVNTDNEEDGCRPVEEEEYGDGRFFDHETATKYTRADLADAYVAAAYKAAAEYVDHLSTGHADAIRAIVTQPQTDALQAMIDAAVKEAQAEDAAKIDAANRIMRVLDKLDAANAFSRPNDVPLAMWDNLDGAKYQYRALAKIGCAS